MIIIDIIIVIIIIVVVIIIISWPASSCGASATVVATLVRDLGTANCTQLTNSRNYVTSRN